MDGLVAVVRDGGNVDTPVAHVFTETVMVRASIKGVFIPF